MSVQKVWHELENKEFIKLKLTKNVNIRKNIVLNHNEEMDFIWQSKICQDPPNQGQGDLVYLAKQP